MSRRKNNALPWWLYETKEDDARESNERLQSYKELSMDIGLEELDTQSNFFAGMDR